MRHAFISSDYSNELTISKCISIQGFKVHSNAIVEKVVVFLFDVRNEI